MPDHASRPDVAVIEAGASPLEPYNGTLALARILNESRMTLLCAADPYAVIGIRSAFDLSPDLVSGPAANITVGVALVRRRAGSPAVNLVDGDSRAGLRALLMNRLGIQEE